MPELRLLRADHAPALLNFETQNRSYFAASIPDRGDDYFANFEAWHQEILAEQAAGLHYFHVIVDDAGAVLGRVNLVEVEDESAELGYRIAERAAGQGLATMAVKQVCARAADEYGLTTLRARTTLDNVGSQKVLAHAGFLAVGEIELAGRPGLRYERHLFGS